MIESKFMYLVMGEKCNLDCKYCKQHKNGIKKETLSDENLSILTEYIREQAEREGFYKIMFYGGEPLIYWEEILRVIRATKEIEGLRYGMVTNALLLDEEKIEVIKSLEGKFTFAVSWDGRNSTKSRGFDAWKERKEVLKKTPYMSTISGVLSTENYIKDYLDDCEELIEEYAEAQGIIPSIVIETITSNMPNEKVAYVDYENLTRQSEEIWKEYLKGDKLAVNAYMENIFDKIKRKEDKYSGPDCGCCGTGVIDVDLSLNIYSCHCFFNEKKIGAWNTPEIELEKHFKPYLDRHFKRYTDKCHNCPIEAICDSGCTMLIKENMDVYCATQKARYMPIIEGIFNS